MHICILIGKVLKGILEWGYAYSEFSNTNKKFPSVIYNAINVKAINVFFSDF